MNIESKNASALDYARWTLEEILTMHADNQSNFNNGNELENAREFLAKAKEMQNGI